MSNGFQKFISGKGFYLALAVCLAGAGAAAWVAVDKTIQSVEPAPMAEKPQLKQEQPYEPAKKQPAADTPSAQSDGDSSPSTQSQQLQITAEAPEEDPSAQASSQPSSQENSSEAQQPSSQTCAEPSEPQPSSDFSLELPVSGAAITPFSGDMLVKNETLGDWRTHNGIDIRAEAGEAVRAASDGTVTAVRNDPMWGNVVEVTSGEYVMTYAGLSADILVKMDQSIRAGEQLGSVGEVPCELSMEPHLHFDVRSNGEYVESGLPCKIDIPPLNTKSSPMGSFLCFKRRCSNCMRLDWNGC